MSLLLVWLKHLRNFTVCNKILPKLCPPFEIMRNDSYTKSLITILTRICGPYTLYMYTSCTKCIFADFTIREIPTLPSYKPHWIDTIGDWSKLVVVTWCIVGTKKIRNQWCAVYKHREPHGRVLKQRPIDSWMARKGRLNVQNHVIFVLESLCNWTSEIHVKMLLDFFKVLGIGDWRIALCSLGSKTLYKYVCIN